MSNIKDFYYILDNKNNTVCVDYEQWVDWNKNFPSQKVVGRTKIGNSRISTVFLSFDHDLFGSEPILFETMVFSNDCNNGYMERYQSYDLAAHGHEKAVRAVINGENLHENT